MIIWYKSKYLQCFGSAIKRRLICFHLTQTESVFWFFTLSAESVIHIELSTLRICQLCINRNSHKAWHCTISRMILRCSTHASGTVGQWSSHTELVPVPLHQVLVKYIFKLKTCDINNNSKCEGSSGILACIFFINTTFQICFLGFYLSFHLQVQCVAHKMTYLQKIQ